MTTRTTKTPDGRRAFKWVVEFTVSETWVEDGFNLTDERALAILARELGWANSDTELAARVLKAPVAAAVANAQGGE